jgi:arabinogalactan oligomer/maltooligosaccharide transport system substrate-binding protein
MIRASCLRLVLLTVVGFLLMGCSLFRSEEEGTLAPPAATTRPTAIGTSAGTSVIDPGAPTSLTPTPGPVTLVLWTSEDFAPTSETEGGLQLLEQIQGFQQSQGAAVDVILKKRSGPGGLLDFLTTASKAAPSVLPDLITLSEADLYRAAQAGLLQPLDELLSPQLLDDQFDFARELTRFGDVTLGVFYQADLSHLVYDTVAVETPPLTWRDLYSSTVPFVFSPAAPAGGVNDVILIQYLDLGGRLTDDQGQTLLDLDPLTQALEFFSNARQSNVVPRSVLGLSDATSAWATFRIGEAGMVQVPASLYLAERAGLSTAGFSTVPLSNPGLTTIGRGWALALVTQDPQRQELAAALVEYLLMPENNGPWTQAAGRLPARQTALDFWDQDDPYLSFVPDLLDQAQPALNPSLAAVVGGPLGQALTSVLSGQATPAEAAQTAIEAVETGE